MSAALIVTIEEDSVLVHPTRDRAKIPHARRLPTRGHLLAVASTSSDGMLTLDLVHEEDDSTPEDEEEGFWENNFRVDLDKWTTCRQRSGTDVSKLCVTTKDLKAQSRTPQPGKRFSAQGRSRCASMDEVLSLRPVRGVLHPHPIGEPVQPVGPLQSLIAQKMQRAQELLEEMRLEELQRAKGLDSPYLKGIDSPRLYHLRGSDDCDLESRRAEAERLLQEAVSSWRQAKEVLEEVKELQTQSLNRRSEKKTIDSPPTPPPDYRLEDACLCRHHS
ncbi:unnamed protein product [Oncorhynchus mykiss]|uniref:Uncharacterized protein n=1 Tax=Oncorhynchus mykiss TaxID=8022 RepID=A0A060VWK6_ONCMY|nr:unnamed protein product [Oncorhynchus mykiss]